jgi:hypothetical protein
VRYGVDGGAAVLDAEHRIASRRQRDGIE